MGLISPGARETEAGMRTAGTWGPGPASDLVGPWDPLEPEHPSGMSGAGLLAALSSQLRIWRPREASPWMMSYSVVEVILTSEEAISHRTTLSGATSLNGRTEPGHTVHSCI